MDTTKLLTLVKVPQYMSANDVRFLANNILITFGPAQQHILNRTGGLGSKQTWQVTGFGSSDNRIWAARVAPVPPTSQYYTDGHFPFVLLAHHRNARPGDANRIQTWQPVSADKQYIFHTIVGEKVQLRIEAEAEGEGEFDSLVPRQNLKRQHSPPSHNFRARHGPDENRRPNGANRGGYQNRGRGGGGGRGGNNNNNSRGLRGTGSGRGGGSNSRGRGGAHRGGYKSLDDVGPSGGRYHAQRGEPNYDDYVPSGDGYNAAFPALGSGGLPYGK